MSNRITFNQLIDQFTCRCCSEGKSGLTKEKFRQSACYYSVVGSSNGNHWTTINSSSVVVGKWRSRASETTSAAKKVVAARWLSLILRHVCIYYNWLPYSLIFHSIISNLPPTYSRNTTDERNVFLHDNQTFIRLISDTSVLSWHDNFRVFLSFEMPLLLEEMYTEYTLRPAPIVHIPLCLHY